MRIPLVRFQMRTILLAIATLAALLALGLQLGTLSEEARRARRQREVEKNQQIIDRNQQDIDKNQRIIDRNQQIIDGNRQEMERTQQVLEKNRAEIERMQRQLEEMNRASTGNQTPKDG